MLAAVALNKSIMKKHGKHEGIKWTAEWNLNNTVNDLVARALEDSQVSDKEFHYILLEMYNCRNHKAGIRHRARADLKK